MDCFFAIDTHAFCSTPVPTGSTTPFSVCLFPSSMFASPCLMLDSAPLYPCSRLGTLGTISGFTHLFFLVGALAFAPLSVFNGFVWPPFFWLSGSWFPLSVLDVFLIDVALQHSFFFAFYPALHVFSYFFAFLAYLAFCSPPCALVTTLSFFSAPDSVLTT